MGNDMPKLMSRRAWQPRVAPSRNGEQPWMDEGRFVERVSVIPSSVSLGELYVRVGLLLEDQPHVVGTFAREQPWKDAGL